MPYHRPKSWNASENEVTPKTIYADRRKFLKTAAWSFAGAAALPMFPAQAQASTPLDISVRKEMAGGEALTARESITGYTNFYEFSTDKSLPTTLAKDFKTEPWTVQVDGLAAKTGTFDVWDLIDKAKLEERIYRHRCVEGWSMVVPWVGVPLADVVKTLEPLSQAKYVAFETLHDPDRMVGQNRNVLDWPYKEGLRLDEALNPLPMLVVGLYGDVLEPQNGAPLRLIVPWKYGFKGIKSIVKIRFTDIQPPNTWNLTNPREYGFYANVNPAVDHPRWTQAKERRIGEFFRRETLMFNGYGEDVAHLYAGMDLARHY